MIQMKKNKSTILPFTLISATDTTAVMADDKMGELSIAKKKEALGPISA